jgi:hypothetical protein
MKKLFNVPIETQVRLLYKSVDELNITPVQIANNTLNSTGYGLNDVKMSRLLFTFLFFCFYNLHI